MIINILGTEYTIIRSTAKKHPLLNETDGFMDESTKEIVIIKNRKPSPGNSEYHLMANEKAVLDRTLRHEIIHAFIAESGLSKSSTQWDEEIIASFFDLQIPKMLKAFQEADCI